MTKRRCPKHPEALFTKRRDGYHRCPRCSSEAVTKRRRVVRDKLIAIFGGECLLCGYSRSAFAMDFHHPDPSQKDFGVCDGNTRAWVKTLAEAKKCVLLCKNCHMEVEHGDLALPVRVIAEQKRVVQSNKHLW